MKRLFSKPSGASANTLLLSDNPQNETPLRDELFSAHQMEQHGQNLGRIHKISTEQSPDRLLSRLAENERVISQTCDQIVKAVTANSQITPAEEWLLDNFYLIEEQIRTAKRHLPKGYSRGLPRLIKGGMPDHPRVYELALEAISHSDARIDAESLTRFISAYQMHLPLKLGELWAIPIMLRLALIENLRRVSARLSVNRSNHNLAGYWAEQMIAMSEKKPTELIVVIADMARANPSLEGSFVAELARRLQGQGPALALPLSWVEQRLSEFNMTMEQLIQIEIQQQAADQVSISNSIGSLRFLGNMNWRKFVEDMSHVEKILAQDPMGQYEAMDFLTRDQYRHRIEKVAKFSNFSEIDVAQKALDLTREAMAVSPSKRQGHIGYFLVDKGVAQLEQKATARLPFLDRVRRLGQTHPLLHYLGTIGLLTVGVTAYLSQQAYDQGMPNGALVALGIAAVFGTSYMAVALVNWLATLMARPDTLPRMDFSQGIPADCRTLVAVHDLMTDTRAVDEMCEGLEVRFLANRDPHLHFCLLTDFPEAKTETLPSEDDLLDYAGKCVAALNEKYSEGRNDIFFLLHRPRTYNTQDNNWIGRERKRGKLGDLNEFLQTGATKPFSLIVGQTSILRDVRYVMTLDADTQLPRDTACQCIGAMAHPLNRPVLDEKLKRIVEGYGILQPRVAVTLPGDITSHYANLSGGEPGLDPYTRAVSDVYQDAFGEGSFIGKGIYDVAAFEDTLKYRFPENRILSHDLIEGNYARSGLLSDVQLYEEYPSRYSADVSRRHRWIRGDWQIFSWLLPTVPTWQGSRERNTVSALGRWKIFDNLRRSVVPLSLLAILLLGWLMTPMARFWTLAIVGIILIPPIVASLLNLARKPKDISVKQHLASAYYSTLRHFLSAAFSFATLPYEALYHTDAIMRAVWRMLVSKRKLMEWTPSNITNRKGPATILQSYRVMWVAPILAAALLYYFNAYFPGELIHVIPVLALWFIAPGVAWWISKPLGRKQAELNDKQIRFLRKITRKTWAFFETFVGPEDNYLPPDNFQEYPVSVVAHRTSPTNIGMSLLANLTAHDFGYASTRCLIERTDNTLQSMAKLERYQGHFYNWYDTTSLVPLHPIYVSTVDSGNLVGHLLTLRPGLLSIADQPIVSPRVFHGLQDTLDILIDAAQGDTPVLLADFAKELNSACQDSAALSLPQFKAVLERLNIQAHALSNSPDTVPETEISWWAEKLAQQCQDWVDDLNDLLPWLGQTELPNDLPTVPALRQLRDLSGNEHFKHTSDRAHARISKLQQLATQAAEMAQIDYDFLYDKDSNLLTIGYNVSENRRDHGFYDLLASEARLASFVAIAQGKIPQRNWFALGRQLTTTGSKSILLSWSGSMFEYLMPLLVMPDFDKTLLSQTYKSVIQHQISYAAQRGVPWGISESGYNAFDTSLNYQYRAFGVPGLGLKRGLADDLVIAPYASVMGMMVDPEASCQNMQYMSATGIEGRYGFYEAVDYTPSRLPRNKKHAIIRSFMAHHQGMSLLSLAYFLLERPMQKRFEADPSFQATMLLLHEKIPKATAYYSNTTELSVIRTARSKQLDTPLRVLSTAQTPVPEVHLLSNGRYHVMVTNAGGSSSRWHNVAVTRWREDTTRDNWGMFCYVRDMSTGDFWSTTYQPTLAQPKHYEAIFSEGRAEFRRRDNDIDIHTEIVVSPEDDIELRRSRITNRSRTRRTIELTSYAEVVMAPQPADAAHPAFSNLFVQTEIMPQRRAILCSRRARSAGEKPPFMFHQMSVHGTKTGPISYETDRMKFIGRGNTTAAPAAMFNNGQLSGSEGSVLDPIVAIRQTIALEPGQSITVDLVTGMHENRDGALHLMDKYQDSHLADRVSEMAWTHSQVILRQLNASETDAQLYERLANTVVYPHAALRGDTAALIKNRRGQSGLWSYAISGDLPIVVLRIQESNRIDLVRQMVQAHAYWRLKGLIVDLVIWNEDQGGYRQVLQDQIMGLIAAGVEAHSLDRPGGIFVRPGDQIPPEDRMLLESVARVIITDNRGTLAEQVARLAVKERRMPRLETTAKPMMEPQPALADYNLVLDNGLGGFTADGREYVIRVKPGQNTPAPWSNVLANPYFGTVISERGQSYTWSENAHALRLTPWHNDPVSDLSGEAFYLRDEETGQVWSPMPGTMPSTLGYVTRHGFGYSIFEHVENGIYTEMRIFVAMDAPVKFSTLKIRNLSNRPRKLSATGYVEWVLGDMRSKTGMHIVTEIEPITGAVLARNSYNTEFAGRIAFFDVDDKTRTITCDRAEFIGRNGSLQNPLAMSRSKLSGKTGPGLDPCTAIQLVVDLEPGEERDVTFRLGMAGRIHEEASSLIRHVRGADAVDAAFEAVDLHWRGVLGSVQIETPDQSINILANGWLMYQTIACRIWARSGYYQSGGAFGFRDQLQDVMATIYAKPQLTREHLLRSAAHQFVEGDAQHWWHPPSDRGVRTKCSDDYLWLPLSTWRYVTATNDTGVLDEVVPFIEGRLLNADEESYYDLPQRSSESASLYEHCKRAILHGLRFGERGLPLIGSCDWNDGMDRVGEHGKGESVWLGFFLYDIMMRFKSIAEMKNDIEFAARCDLEAQRLQKNIEANAWDGNWYRRAYFDNGTPLGSAQNTECQIDSLSQSWAVLSGAGDPARARQGMAAADARLVRRDAGIVQLLDPPFDKSEMNPGYIRGYVPGVRENGGQYTHAAIWTAMAFAKLGDRARTWELLQIINPVNHGRTSEDVATYRVEPYVVTADVYGVAPHTGRGGWSWYTGSSGWMYRLIVESMLGLDMENNTLRFKPCLPPEWNGFKMRYYFRSTTYNITVEQWDDTCVTIDDVQQKKAEIKLIDDGAEHDVIVKFN